MAPQNVFSKQVKEPYCNSESLTAGVQWLVHGYDQNSFLLCKIVVELIDSIPKRFHHSCIRTFFIHFSIWSDWISDWIFYLRRDERGILLAA